MSSGLPAWNVHELIEFLMKWTEPSQKAKLAPPGWLLPAADRE